MNARTIGKRLFDALSSLRLAVALLVLMLVVTFLGTLHQTEAGIYPAQVKYFESFFFLQEIGGVEVLPLPGGYLLMSLLTLNLILGGVVRLRWNRRRTGILITHFGILFLMLSAMVTAELGIEGQMKLYEGERAAHFADSRQLELAVLEELADGRFREYTIGSDAFSDLGEDLTRTVDHPDLPFALELGPFYQDGQPLPAPPFPGGGGSATTPVVDGWYFQPNQIPAKEPSSRAAGLYARIQDADATTANQRAILWNVWVAPFNQRPWTVTIDGTRYAVMLRNVRHELPFTIRLEDFHHEFHPGTSQPRVFESQVTVIADGVEQPYLIEMNEPLRRGPHVAYQSGWGPQGAPPSDGRYFSILQIARNPADQWPTYATFVIAGGLCIHFGWMLIAYVRRELEESRS